MADDFDPFKSGLAVPVSTSRPVFNATSTAAAPKAPKDFDPFESGAATPVDDNSFDPFASGKADDLDPEAIHARELNDPNFNPSTEQLQALYSAEQKKSFGSQVVEGAKSAIVAPVTAAAKVPGEQIGLAKNLATRLGETSVPVKGQTATDAVARNAVPVLDYLGKEASTALDAASQFGTSVGGFAMKPVKMAGELLKDYWDADVNGEIPKGESFEDWSQKYLTNLALSRSSNSAEFQKLTTSAPGFEPAPNTASTLSTAAQLAMMKAPALGASGEAALAAGKTGLVDQAIKNAGAPVPLTSAETIANGAGTVIDKAGTIARAVGGAPRKLAQAALAPVIGDDAAASVTKMGEVAAAHNPVVQGLLATEGVGAGAQRVGQAVTAIAGTPAAGPFGRLVNLAKSADTPGWLKNLASNPAVRTLYGAASDASAMTGSAVKGIAKGAATGAAYGVVSGDSPEELGSDISTFGAFGAAHAGGALKERAFQRRAAGVMDLVGKNLAAGVDPATLAKVPDAAMLAAADIPYLGIKDAQGRDLQVQFKNSADMKQTGADGYYDPPSHTIFLNADNLKNNPASWSSIFHELLHPLALSEVANRPELMKQIDDSLTASGKTLDAAKIAYIQNLLKPEFNAAGITDPVEQAKQVQARVAQEDTDSAAQWGDSGHWMRAEILADAGRDALATDKGINSPQGALAAALKPSALEMMRRALEKLGIKFTPDTSNARTVIPGFQDVVSDPSLRKTVFRLLKAQRDFTPGVSKGAEQSAPLTAADMGTPKAPWHQLANGRLGNKYSEAVPDGKGGVKTVMRNPRQVKKLELAEAKAVKKYIHPGQRVSDLPPAFYADPNIGEWTKQAARAAAKSARSGEPLEAWYHGVGKSGEADWKGSVRKMLGNVTASRQNFYVMPNGMFVSKAGNPLMDVFSLSGLERKAQAWMNRKGPLSLDLWNGDINKFRADVNTYNQNHAAGIPGESNNLGVDKKNVINAFLYGRNAKFEANNPLRSSLRSAEDRQGIVRSLRLDRLETLEPGKSDLTRPDYPKGVKNFSPEASAQKSVDDAAKEERPVVAPNLGGGESTLTPEQQALSRKNNSREAFEALNKGKLPGAQFSPKAKLKLEDAVGDKEIPVIHFSSKSGLTSVDPEFFGKGRANRNDTNGSKKSFFFVKGSKLGGDEPIFGQGGFTKHEGVVDGNKIYDLSANKPDPLGYFDTLNREKADSNVKAAGYDGILVGTSDGRKVVMMFKPVKVKAGGAFKGNKAYSPEAQLKTRTPNEDVRKVAADYVASAGIPSAPHQGYAPINEAVSRKVADFYDEAKHDPENPAVKASYDALKNETAAQYKAAEAAGMKFEPWTGEGQPYKNSAEMTADVRDNKHLWYFPTETGYGVGVEKDFQHPLLESSGIRVGGKDIPVNDVFRAVHDYFGHAKEGYEFGPRGELNAFLSHAQMYSDAAKPAMAMETMGQNSWVNFGKHLRDSEGKIPAKGEVGYVPVTERPYAEQKANVLPPETLADNKAFSPRAETRDSDETEKFSPKAELKDTERFAKRISSLTEKTGGTTFNIAKGRPIGKNKNFGVSIYPDRSVVLAPKDLTPEVVQKFITDNSDLLSNPENNVGTWLDKASGKVYLDVSVGFADRKLAEYAGKKYNQKAIWDSEKSEEIPTGGSGEPLEHMPEAAERTALLRHEYELQNPPTGQQQIPGMGRIVLNPDSDEMKNIRDLEAVRPDRELSPNEQAASDLARQEVRQRVQLLPSVDDRVKVRRAIQKGVEEVSAFLQKQAANPQFDAGKDWYGKDIKKMEETTKALFPETQSPDKMSLFKLLLAAFSGGATPKENFQLASEAFAHYLRTGEIPATSDYRVSETGAKRKLGRQAEMTADKLSGMLEKHGGEAGMMKYLLTKHEVTDGGNKEAYGALDLGPKFGRFFLNLMGHQQEVTVDLWATRTWRRWMGTPFARVAGEGGTKMAMPDIPTDEERNAIFESFKKIADNLNNELPKEEHLTPMSVQAMLWFYEKDLYAARGVKVDRGSFSQASKDYAANPIHKRTAPVVTGQKVKTDPNQAKLL